MPWRLPLGKLVCRWDWPSLWMLLADSACTSTQVWIWEAGWPLVTWSISCWNLQFSKWLVSLSEGLLSLFSLSAFWVYRFRPPIFFLKKKLHQQSSSSVLHAVGTKRLVKRRVKSRSAKKRPENFGWGQKWLVHAFTYSPSFLISPSWPPSRKQ